MYSIAGIPPAPANPMREIAGQKVCPATIDNHANASGTYAQSPEINALPKLPREKGLNWLRHFHES